MPKKSIFKRWWFWLIAVILVIGIANMNNSGDVAKKEATSSPVGSPDKSNDVSEQVINDPVPSETSSAVPSDENRAITQVGEVITTKNFKIALEKFNKPKGSQFISPGDGNEFVDVVLVIENISDSDYTVSSLLMFNAYHDGFSTNQSISGLTADNSISSMDGALAAGKKIRGKLSYELPKDWKELEIDVDLTKLSLFSNDGEIKIVLQNTK